jgi:hypothetical protein
VNRGPLDGESAMPKHKSLKSVVNSLADSFTGPLNYSDDDFVMGHLLTAARSYGKNELSVDLLTGHATPSELLVPDVKKGVEWYVKQFPDMIVRSNSTMAFVKEATLRVSFDTSVALRRGLFSQQFASPYICRVRIVDDRGKVYERIKQGAFASEKVQPVTLAARVKGLFSKKPQ